MGYCFNCGSEIKEGYDFCPECGAKMESTQDEKIYTNFDLDKYKICKICGEKMPEDAFYCLSCGHTFDSQQSDFENVKQSVLNSGNAKRAVDTSIGVWKNKWIALLLCLFFGVFGMHRFYEGKKVTGFIYLFTFGLFGLGVFFDLILIVTKPNPYRVK